MEENEQQEEQVTDKPLPTSPPETSAVPTGAAPPTVEQARVMMLENPGIDSVVTDVGKLSRDGSLHHVPTGE